VTGDPGFDGKMVAITGAGRAGQVADILARAFAARGAALALLGRAQGDLDARAAELRAAGARVHTLACDLADADAVAGAARALSGVAPGGLHALVHAAGGFGASGPVAESDPEQWHRQLSINLTTAYLTTRALLPLLRAARGSIVYFASAAALPGADVAGLSAYAAAKGGVLTLMRAVAAEERRNGVRANAVAPQAIRTASNVAAMGADARYVEPDELAGAVLYLASGGASAVSGEVIALG
jgi:NAD(P)-dependent dehydrogenase (short-subunit alcohol dehydrogenase family)